MIIKLIISCLSRHNDKNHHRFKSYSIGLLFLFTLLFFFISCKRKVLPNQDMIDLLKTAEAHYNSPNNIFCPEAMVKSCDSVLDNSSDKDALMQALNKKANALLQLGEEQKAIDIFG